MEITDIKRELSIRAQAVAELLLPNGRKESSEWRVGSIGGEPGQSLGVHLTGPKAGVWSDFAAGKGGDLLDLWCAVRGVGLTEAMNQACDFLGLQRPSLHRPVVKSYTAPEKPKCRKPIERVRDYLVEERNIRPDILDAYRIGEDGLKIVFPFIRPDGTLAMVKTRDAVDGAKPVPTAAGCEKILFGWQAIPENAREVVLTEGEIDALSVASMGRAALSVPFGGGGGNKQDWIESEYDNLDRFEKIYLCLDMDEPGEQAAQTIAERLGRHRCYRVRLPKKDANECLVDGMTAEEFTACLSRAETYDPAGLKLPSAFSDQVVNLFYPEPGKRAGCGTPYGKLSGKLLFRPSEVTIWSGDSGAGKSQILSDCVVHWVSEGARVCLSSLEMAPAQTLKRMVKQTVGADRPPQDMAVGALQWLDRGLILYELTGKASAESLLKIFDYARAKYGCDVFVIDSLMRLGLLTDDYNSQEAVMYELVNWAIAKNVHVHLVAHSRKGDQQRGAPETADIKGAMEVGANAFNIITIWRDRKHEQAVKENPGDESLKAKPGVVLNVAKQRNGDFEGKIGLWFDQETYQYRSAEDSKMRRCYIEGERMTA